MQAYEVNSQGVKLAEGVHELPEAARESVIAIDQHRVELPAPGVREKSIQRGPRFLAARHAGVRELLRYFPSPPLAIRAKFLELHLSALLGRTDSPINRTSHRSLLSAIIGRRITARLTGALVGEFRPYWADSSAGCAGTSRSAPDAARRLFVWF